MNPLEYRDKEESQKHDGYQGYRDQAEKTLRRMFEDIVHRAVIDSEITESDGRTTITIAMPIADQTFYKVITFYPEG